MEMTSALASTFIMTGKTMTRVMMSGCKSSINGYCLSCYGSLIFSFSFLAFEVLRKAEVLAKEPPK